MQTCFNFQKQSALIDARRRENRYNETETLQLLSQTHLHSPASLKHNNNNNSQVQRFGQFMRPGDQSHMIQMFPQQFGSSNYQVNILFNNVLFFFSFEILVVFF